MSIYAGLNVSTKTTHSRGFGATVTASVTTPSNPPQREPLQSR